MQSTAILPWESGIAFSDIFSSDCQRWTEWSRIEFLSESVRRGTKSPFGHFIVRLRNELVEVFLKAVQIRPEIHFFKTRQIFNPPELDQPEIHGLKPAQNRHTRLNLKINLVVKISDWIGWLISKTTAPIRNSFFETQSQPGPFTNRPA